MFHEALHCSTCRAKFNAYKHPDSRMDGSLCVKSNDFLSYSSPWKPVQAFSDGQHCEGIIVTIHSVKDWQRWGIHCPVLVSLLSCNSEGFSDKIRGKQRMSTALSYGEVNRQTYWQWEQFSISWNKRSSSALCLCAALPENSAFHSYS